jgi:hypothetical protein
MKDNFAEFEDHVRHTWMYETIYDDSEGRRILVLRLLNAYAAMRRAIDAEREACAKVCDDIHSSEGWYNCGQAEQAAIAIRARGLE